jgi:Zn2+/Cd2+-exporting ATPase
MDKTGTVTIAEPEVMPVIPLGGHTEAELMQRSKRKSMHPRAHTTMRYAQKQSITLIIAADVQVLK